MKKLFSLAAIMVLLTPLDGLSQSQPVNGSPADGRNLLLATNLTEARVLPQNWSDADAQRFYNTTQGSQMMPYDWFLHLEQAGSTNLFRDADNIRSLGYLPRSPDQAGNPDGLPIGFVRNDKSVGLTCAACHTAQINYQGTAWLIDGGPTLGDAQSLMRNLEAALKATLTDPDKFNRFADGVLGQGNSDPAKTELKRELQVITDTRTGYNQRNFPPTGHAAFGPGRIDAFDAIFNEVAVRFAQCSNAETKCDAPVSYPFLWDTPQHDRVQWNGSAQNTKIGPFQIGALGRNIGEVLGVFADVDTTVQENPLGGYPSSVNTGTLTDLEDDLRNLWSPQWPDAFGKIDANQAAQGAVLFGQYCASCHQDIKRTDPNRTVTTIMRAVGTDQSMARNAAERRSGSGIFAGRRLLLPPFRKLGTNELVSDLLVHLGQRVLVGLHPIEENDVVQFKYDTFAEVGVGPSKLSLKLKALHFKDGKLHTAQVQYFARLEDGQATTIHQGADLTAVPSSLEQKFTATPESDQQPIPSSIFTASAGAETPVQYEYKARPLNGIWATAPYLHNGSVLNLDELLKPAAQRLTTFHLGSREFDPKNVGYVNAGDFIFDTQAQPANSNAGHEYGGKVFTDQERAQLIEYLKSL